MHCFEFLMPKQFSDCGAVLPCPTSAITSSGSQDVCIQLQLDFREPMAAQQLGLSCTLQVWDTILTQPPYCRSAQPTAPRALLPSSGLHTKSRDGVPLKLSTSQIWENPGQLLSKSSENNSTESWKSWLPDRKDWLCMYEPLDVKI